MGRVVGRKDETDEVLKAKKAAYAEQKKGSSSKFRELQGTLPADNIDDR